MRDAEFQSLRSSRLTIRRFRADDADALAAYRNDPEVARYQAWERCSVDEAARFIASLGDCSPGTPGEWFQFAVSSPSTPLIGDCALRCLRSDPRQAELGFTFARPFQGQGYATEAVARLLDYAFLTLDLHRVFSLTDERNFAAQRLLERLRFRLEGRFVQNAWFKGEWASERLYAILPTEWKPGPR
jgi:RimJ/RimL family protein N-acetyltransferase